MENANSTICAGLEPSDGESPVSWQTAWFAVAAIAMNSMSTPNGMVLGFPSTWGEALRSSPLICLFDALELSTFWLIAIVFNGEGPRVAARRVARVRFSDILAADERTRREGDQSLSAMRSRFWIAQVAFGIATLTQAVKLFALRGVIGCQICALFYLYSWAVSWALVLCAGHDMNSPLPPLKPGRVRAITAQGLLPYVPFHVIGVLFHTAWIYDLQSDVIISTSFYETKIFDDGVGSLIWTVSLILLSAVIPFLLYKMDSFRCIGLTPTQLRGFSIMSIATVGVFRAWNAAIVPLFVKGEAIPCAYIGNDLNWPIIDIQLCAFTQATREKISGIVPLTFFLTYAAIMAADPAMYTEYLIQVIMQDVLAVFIAIALFPRSVASWLVSRAPSGLSNPLGKLRLREFTKKYALSITGFLIAITIAIFPLVRRTISGVVNAWWKITYVLLLLLNWMLDSHETTSSEVAGVCFVGANFVWTLLWFWKAWGDYHPECTAKPGWTECLG